MIGILIILIEHWVGDGAACEACGAMWDLGTNSALALGLRKTTGNLD
jgi:hypothetical protein